MDEKPQRARLEVPRTDPLLIAQALVGKHMLIKAEFRGSPQRHRQLALRESAVVIDDCYHRLVNDMLGAILDHLGDRVGLDLPGRSGTRLHKAAGRKPLLTTRKLQELANIIRKHHTALAFTLTGDATGVDKAALSRLIRSGVLPRTALKVIDDAYLLGHLIGHAQGIDPTTFSYKDFKEHIQKHPVPLTERDEHALDFARHRAATYIRGLGNKIADDFTTEAIETEAAQRAQFEGEIREGLESNIEGHESWRKLASDLGHRTQDWARDLRRIAATEKQRALQEGFARGLQKREKRKPHQINVAKIPAPDACPHCKKLHLVGGAGKPIVFSLAELQQNGTNVGRRQSDWQATVGPVHPWCACELVHVPPGWEFDDSGDLVPTSRSTVLDTDLRKALTYGDSVPEKGCSIRIGDPTIRAIVENVIRQTPQALFDKQRGVTLITTDIPRPESRLDEHDLAYWTGNEIRLSITLPPEKVDFVLKHELGHGLNVWLRHQLGSTEAVREWHDKLYAISEKEGFVSDYAKKEPIENAAEVTRLYLYERPKLMLDYPRQFAFCYDAYRGATR